MKKEIYGAKPVFVESVLDMSKLEGRRNCEILFVGFRGDYPALCAESRKRNINITSISKKRYNELTRGRSRHESSK